MEIRNIILCKPSWEIDMWVDISDKSAIEFNIIDRSNVYLKFVNIENYIELRDSYIFIDDKYVRRIENKKGYVSNRNYYGYIFKIGKGTYAIVSELWDTPEKKHNILSYSDWIVKRILE